MIKKKIAVITANEQIGRFFSLELQTLGYEVRIARHYDRGGEADLNIVDLDTVSSDEPVFSATDLFVSSRPQTDGRTLLWPVDIDELRDAVASSFYQDSEFLSKPIVDKSVEARIVDREMGMVFVGELCVKLSETELSILEYLCEAEGNTVSRADIMRLLQATDGNISDVYICHLRKKLELTSGKRFIFTERGKGYRTTLVMAKNKRL